jgi:hypothetical protein
MPDIDVVLGMDFHTDSNHKFNYHKRQMKVKVVKDDKLVQEIKLQAYSGTPSLPFIESNGIELCYLEAFSKEIKQEPNVSAFIGYVKLKQFHSTTQFGKVKAPPIWMLLNCCYRLMIFSI